MNAAVTLQLTHAEALVLFEWLASNQQTASMAFADEAERIVLWKLEGQLEKTLREPFWPNYRELLAAARALVRVGET